MFRISSDGDWAWKRIFKSIQQVIYHFIYIRYSSTLSLASALDGSGWSTPRTGQFTPRERSCTHCTEG
jgi:hypothetical protein